MAESTLSETFPKLQAEVGRYWGFRQGILSGDVTLDAGQTQIVADCIDEGYRQVTQPPILPGEVNSYDWSYMKPVRDFILAAVTNEINMPDDFGGLEGKITVGDTSGDWFKGVMTLSGPEVIAKQTALPTLAGPPQAIGLDWLPGTTATAGQRARLVVFPKADQQYVLKVQYYVLENALSADRPYPWGGMMMSSVILASCLAVAEKKMTGQSGIWAQTFMERLAATVSADRRLKQQSGGYNHDRSDRYDDQRNWRLANPQIVTYTGS